MIAHVSRDWLSALDIFVLVFSWMAIDRDCEFFMCLEKSNGDWSRRMVYCTLEEDRQYFMAASHVLTPQGGQGMLHLQRHLLASDARDDIEIMYEERHDRYWQVGKLILQAPKRINTICLRDRK